MDVTELSGLPEGAREHFLEAGFEELYPPQEAAVEAGVLDGENLVASVPTASGKTFIAAMAMLSAIERGGTALYIVPLRALASEKREEFAGYEAFGVETGISTGNYESTDDWLASKDLIVATSEKVDSLVRNDASWLRSVSCVVADEVHLVDDASRGPTLEVTLAKLRQLTQGLQVVALSATIGNAEVIAEWLDAALVDTDWRPIDLRTGVHFGNALHMGDGSTREVPVDDSERQEEALVRDILAEDGSSLVFVNSRRNAEGAAKRLARVTGRELEEDQRERLAALAADIRDVSDAEASDELAACVEKGAAYHHAGLASEHRSIVEDAFRERTITAISATPTLAAGVNTPARRVVVRDWQRYDPSAGGMAPLSVLEVHQMMGRAGRPGRDPYGEAVLLASSHDQLDDLLERYVWADPEPVTSKLAAEPALRTHVLATVASGFARTRAGLLGFLEETLYASQAADYGLLESVTDEVLAYLEANDFLERGGEELAATSLGHTVSRLYIDPMSAAEIVNGLETAADRPTALGCYHLVSRTPDMYELYLRKGEDERYAEMFYERETELLGPAPSEFDRAAFETWLSALKTARLLEEWAEETDEGDLTEDYGIGPGDLRGKVETAAWLLGAAESLAVEVDSGWTPAVREARARVEDGVKEELLELVSVRGVGRKRARRLFRAGIATPADLRTADKDVVLAALEGPKTAESILENVGREDPSMDGVSPAQGVVPTPKDRQETNEDQASLGDF